MAKKQSYLKKKQTFSGAQVLLFVLVFAAVGAVAIWQSLAAPHKPGGGYGLSLVMVTDQNNDGQPNFGDTITFNVTDSNSFPSVALACSQNGTVVYTHTSGFYPGYFWTDNYLLAGGNWSSGAADCTATLYHTTKTNRNITDTTLSFHVNA